MEQTTIPTAPVKGDALHLTGLADRLRHGAAREQLLAALKEIMITQTPRKELHSYGISKRVRRLTKHADPSVARLAAYAIRQWNRAWQQNGQPLPDFRTRARSMLEVALEIEPDPVTGEGFNWDSETAARLIEQRLFDVHGGVGRPYKEHVRAIYLNLTRDGTTLRAQLLAGKDPPSRVCGMSQADLSPDWVKAEVKAAQDRKEKIAADVEKFKANERNAIGFVECRHCHSKKTRTYEMQTRRADESATVFVECMHCNRRFRMG
jgi:DNA-directed RNA polymerase subunit M/transcription elongation factor TFIIS